MNLSMIVLYIGLKNDHMIYIHMCWHIMHKNTKDISEHRSAQIVYARIFFSLRGHILRGINN